MSEKIFIGKVTAKMITGNSEPWEKITIALGPQDIEKIAQHKNEKGWINLLFKKGQSGNYYMEVDTWKPTNQGNAAPASNTGYSVPPAPEDDLPF